ncbi:phospholipase (plasmid) [Streptomyces clavuligerus]|nr:phospholipase [Streptomyces clavuligerus]QCS09924.1 phospholipase [Streptomyces clavuligerus]QPJ98030.1 phospholipase [Streptomyces clavuligerus]
MGTAPPGGAVPAEEGAEHGERLGRFVAEARISAWSRPSGKRSESRCAVGTAKARGGPGRYGRPSTTAVPRPAPAPVATLLRADQHRPRVRRDPRTRVLSGSTPVRRTVLPVITALSVSLLLPQQPASATTIDQPLANGELQQIGPGSYQTAERSFEIAETDVAAGAIGRRHSVVPDTGGVARPESAPSSRTDMGVFGPGWEAEFLGGTLNRKLVQQADAIVVTDLDAEESLRYTLRSSVDFPAGGGVRKYQTVEGDRFTETTRWDAAAGTLVSSAVETIGTDLVTTRPGDDTFTDTAGNPIPAADLQPTYTWKPVVPGGDPWRVTGVGSTANGTATVGYDTQGRVNAISEPASDDTPAQSLTIGYAGATTATGSTLGDFTGRAKEITVTTGTTVQTLARYAYDASGLLRTVTNPVESTDPQATYAYDTTGRVSSLASPTNGAWNLAFAAGSAAPAVSPVGPAGPDPQAPIEGEPGVSTLDGVAPPASDFVDGEISDPQAYPRQCSTAASWMWRQKTGCVAKVAHYGWRNPGWRTTPTGFKVMGIRYDKCTDSPDRPSGFNYEAACDMHDYGLGLIGNTYKGYRYYLDRNKKSAVDSVFYTTLRDKTCPAYASKTRCRATAWVYYQGVKPGNPRNGAVAT